MGLLEILFISFGCCKICQKCQYLQLGTKNKFSDFFLSIPWFSFFYWKTFHTFDNECLFHMDNHIDLVGSVTFVEKISWQKGTLENIIKKGTYFFWFLVGDFDISNIFYKIQNLNSWPVFPVVPLLRKILKAISPLQSLFDLYNKSLVGHKTFVGWWP